MSGGRISEVDEVAILARVRSGDSAAYGELVLLHAPIAKRTAVFLGAGADADDVVQEAFVKAYRALGSFRSEAAFRPWLLRIVANETRNAVRSRSRRSRREELAAPLDVVLDPADAAVSLVRRTELLAAVSALPEPQRLVVTCRYLLELDEQETAVVLGWPRGTVKSRLHRALDRLRKEVPA
ncbi:sigma-70 family RNA polymerase sigma factor [Kribbella sandramycini]|uniref:RNA polymerase sigma factor n=1 Tax=Kribbella sandramycini TaxID=60450 RepID=A0A841S9T8_9ACTN|nr:RNA polymerase sigma-70 factor (ECF subfamily) [Kribbella sandramycini]